MPSVILSYVMLLEVVCFYNISSYHWIRSRGTRLYKPTYTRSSAAVIIQWFLDESGPDSCPEAHISKNTVLKIKHIMNFFASRVIKTDSVQIGGTLRVASSSEV